MADRAQITSGSIAGSALVHILAPDRANGTAIFVFSGPVLIGSGTIASGMADITLSRTLVAGEVIQASLITPGDGCGLPLIVSEPGIVIGGWRTPSEFDVTLPDGETVTMPADQFEEISGYLPASIQDPAGLRAVVYPEYLPEQIRSIQFSTTVLQEPGQTTVTISNITGILGTPLIKWDASESFGTDVSRVFTSGETITLSVKGTNDTDPATRTIVVAVLADSTTPLAGDIAGVTYRFGGSTLRAQVTSKKQCEVRLFGFDSTWHEANFQEDIYQDYLFVDTPLGSYNLQVRVKDDTDSTRWVSLTINKYY